MRFSSSSTSASALRLRLTKVCRVCQSPSTSAWRMNSSRDSSGSIEENSTERSLTSGSP